MTLNVTNAERDAIKFFINQAPLLLFQTNDAERIEEINVHKSNLSRIISKFENRQVACKNAYLVNKQIIKKYKEENDTL